MMWQHPSFSSLLVAKPVETTLTNRFSLKASATETNDLQCFPTILQQQSQERGKTTSINIQPFNIQQCRQPMINDGSNKIKKKQIVHVNPNKERHNSLDLCSAAMHLNTVVRKNNKQMDR